MELEVVEGKKKTKLTGHFSELSGDTPLSPLEGPLISCMPWLDCH